MKDLRIAVIDDDPAYLGFMREVLTDAGEDVILFDGHEDVAETIRQEQPDVVILDLWLGSQDEGWSVLERLRHDPLTVDIPVILCSGDVPVLRERREMLWPRSCLTLPKPFGIDDLLGAIAQAAFDRPDQPPAWGM